jgi:hypothetical protein
VLSEIAFTAGAPLLLSEPLNSDLRPRAAPAARESHSRVLPRLVRARASLVARRVLFGANSSRFTEDGGARAAVIALVDELQAPSATSLAPVVVVVTERPSRAAGVGPSGDSRASVRGMSGRMSCALQMSSAAPRRVGVT